MIRFDVCWCGEDGKDLKLVNGLMLSTTEALLKDPALHTIINHLT